MEPESMEFICKVMNTLASRKCGPEAEQCLSDAIEQELFAIRARAMEQRVEVAA